MMDNNNFYNQNEEFNIYGNETTNKSNGSEPLKQRSKRLKSLLYLLFAFAFGLAVILPIIKVGLFNERDLGYVVSECGIYEGLNDDVLQSVEKISNNINMFMVISMVVALILLIGIVKYNEDIKKSIVDVMGIILIVGIITMLLGYDGVYSCEEMIKNPLGYNFDMPEVTIVNLATFSKDNLFYPVFIAGVIMFLVSIICGKIVNSKLKKGRKQDGQQL